MAKPMKKAAFIVILFLLTHFVCSGVALLLNRAADAEFLGTVLFFGYIVLIVLLWATGLVRKDFGAVSRPVSRIRSTEAVVAMLLLGFSMSIVGELVKLSDNGTTDVFDAMRHNPLCLVLLCVLGPLTEEIVYREGTMCSLMLSGLSPVWAAALSAVVFGLVHGNAAQAFPAVALGFVLGLFYWRTGNIRLCAVAHILNNSLAVLLLYFPTADDAVRSQTPAFRIALAAGLAAVALALLADWWRGTRFSEKRERI